MLSWLASVAALDPLTYLWKYSRNPPFSWHLSGTLHLLSHWISACGRSFMCSLSRFPCSSLNIIECTGFCLIKLIVFIALSRTLKKCHLPELLTLSSLWKYCAVKSGIFNFDFLIRVANLHTEPAMMGYYQFICQHSASKTHP